MERGPDQAVSTPRWGYAPCYNAGDASRVGKLQQHQEEDMGLKLKLEKQQQQLGCLSCYAMTQTGSFPPGCSASAKPTLRFGSASINHPAAFSQYYKAKSMGEFAVRRIASYRDVKVSSRISHLRKARESK